MKKKTRLAEGSDANNTRTDIYLVWTCKWNGGQKITLTLTTSPLASPEHVEGAASRDNFHKRWIDGEFKRDAIAMTRERKQ